MHPVQDVQGHPTFPHPHTNHLLSYASKYWKCSFGNYKF